jgi:hypothetical protein
MASLRSLTTEMSSLSMSEKKLSSARPLRHSCSVENDITPGCPETVAGLAEASVSKTCVASLDRFRTCPIRGRSRIVLAKLGPALVSPGLPE